MLDLGGTLATGTTTIVDVWWTTEIEGGGVLPSNQTVVPLLTEKKYGPLSVVVEASESVGVVLSFFTIGSASSARGFRLMRRLFVIDLRAKGNESTTAGHHVMAEPTFCSDDGWLAGLDWISKPTGRDSVVT